jgi:phage baseplate assembly protein W
LTTLLADIKSRDWQISTQGVGIIAEGLGDIRQCLDIILRTTKGTDPLRPQFGSDIYQYVDQPLTVAIPNIIRCIIEATEIWEKRVLLQKVQYQVRDTSTVDFFVTYRLVDEELIDLLKLQLSGGFLIADTVQVGTLTIYALFPPNPSNKRYQILFKFNGFTAMPNPPAGGFATIAELYGWIVSNWSNYGSWQLAADRIIGSLKPGILSASIQISLLGTLLFEAPIPDNTSGGLLQVSFAPDALPLLTGTFLNVSQMLTWLQTNWEGYGSWNVVGNPAAGGDFDIIDFDENDFNAGSTSGFLLQLLTTTVIDATLQVNKL